MSVSPAPASSAEVAIVILNWNGLDDTRRCLSALRTGNADSFIVVVVDNGSSHAEADAIAAEFPEATVLPQPRNLGYSGGCNVGIAHALDIGARHVLLLNNDATVSPATITALVEAASALPDAGAVSPVLRFSDTGRIWSAGGRVSLPTGSAVMLDKGRDVSEIAATTPFAVDFAPGACLLVPSPVLAEVGLLDEDFFAYWEDVDLCARIRGTGRSCYVVPALHALHAKSASTGQAGDRPFSPLVAYYLARNAFPYARRCLPLPRRWVFLAAQFLVRAPYMLGRRVAAGARLSYLAGMRDGVLGRTGERRAGHTR